MLTLRLLLFGILGTLTGCSPVPQKQVYASKIDLLVMRDGRPVAGLAIERKTVKIGSTKRALQSATTDANGRCIFEAVIEKGRTQPFIEFNIEQDFSISADGVFLFSLQKVNYEPLSEYGWRVSPDQLKVERASDHLRVTLDASSIIKRP
jgi:hypothetical protein